MTSPTGWYRDNFIISTNPTLIQPTAINAAFDSSLVYWVRAIDPTLLKQMLDNSICFGLYELPTSSTDIAGRANSRQIGLARLVTDKVSTAYLTDVYVLKEFQGKELGKWLIDCVNEHISTWPEMRWTFLCASGDPKFYEEHLGAVVLERRRMVQ